MEHEPNQARGISLASSLRVRRASLHELTVARSIVDEYCDAVGVLVRDDQDQLRSYFNDDFGIWLASYAASVIGCIALRPLSAQATACEVKRLYVRESHRGFGVANALMDALEDYAVRRGYRSAYLDTKDDLHAAVRFYERRGYTACDRYNDNPQATIFMRRQFR